MKLNEPDVYYSKCLLCRDIERPTVHIIRHGIDFCEACLDKAKALFPKKKNLSES